MARTVETFIGTFGRDKGKTFILTEMFSRPGHKWACRALFAMGAAGASIPDNIASAGMAGLAVMGLNAFMAGIPFESAEPLLDEMLECVTITYEPNKPGMERRIFWDTDVEEISTVFQLQKAVFLMHTRPFTSELQSTSESEAKVPAQS